MGQLIIKYQENSEDKELHLKIELDEESKLVILDEIKELLVDGKVFLPVTDK